MQNRADAHGDGIAVIPQAMDKCAGFFAGNPAGAPGAGSCFTVSGHRRLDNDEGAASSDILNVDFVQLAGLIFKHPGLNLNSGRLKLFKTFSGHKRVGIFHRCHHLRDSGTDDGLDTGPGAPPVDAGLQVNIKHCPPGALAGLLQGHDLGVRGAGSLMITGPDDLSVANHHCANHRVGVSFASSPASQVQGGPHESIINIQKLSPRLFFWQRKTLSKDLQGLRD